MSLTVTINLDDVAAQVRRAASESISEEDLRIRVESLLKSAILDPLGIPWGRYEYTLVSGVRPDALHAHVVIEYEPPRSFEQKRKYEHAIQQVKDYVLKHAQGMKDRLPRYFGVALDGYRMGFVRYRERLKDFEVSKEPLEVNRSTVARLVEAIVGLKRKALDAEELLKDFGPGSELSRKVIRVLYDRLSNRVTDRTSILFRDWKRVFSQVCAYDPEKLKGLEEQYGFQRGKADVEELLFSLHSYFALLMKLLAAEVGSLYWPIMGSYLKALEDAYYKGVDRLRDQLRELEEGGLFAKLGISNFLEGDYFAWYLDEWDPKVAEAIASVVKKLSDYDPSTAELEPDRIKDLFKRLYQNLVPRKIRHDLGEYYTPDWLAELVLNEVDYTLENFNKLREEKNDALAPLDLRVLDPACGSGTFLVLTIRRLREYIEEHWIDKGSALRRISRNIVGFDLNPLAVMASRANYLISIGDMLREKGAEQVEIPIYLADSILVERKSTVLGITTYSLRTVAGEFRIPIAVVERGILGKVLSVMEECVKLDYTANEFIGRLEVDLSVKEDEKVSLKELYDSISKLEKEGKNRIWLRILRNSFVPFLVDRFDHVIGNPPWVNWENLPESYRDVTKDLWDKYGLLRYTKGFGLGKVKRDMAMLFVTASVDRYLSDSGHLGLLVPFTLFRTQAGAGFRVFLRYKCKVSKIHDLVTLTPFEGALNRTSLLMLSKGSSDFPIPCTSWTKVSNRSIRFEAELHEAETLSQTYAMILEPIEGANKPDSSWLMVKPGAVSGVRKALGVSHYRAYEGVNTALNGVYWISVIPAGPKNIVMARNLASIGKKSLEEKTAPVEIGVVYPLIRGRDVSRWRGQPSGYILVPHDTKTGKPLSESVIKKDYPKAFAFLSEFKKDLQNRSIHKLWGRGQPFYSLYDIGEYTFAPYKVMWKYVAGKISGKGAFSVAVIPTYDDINLGAKTTIPNEKLMLIPFNLEEEAQFVAAVLNSSIARLIVASYTIETAISTHVLKHTRIPKYDAENKLHVELSNLSRKAHEFASQGNTDEVAKVEEKIDRKVSELYGLTEQDILDIKESLAILMGEEVEEEEEEEVPSLEPNVTLRNNIVDEGKPPTPEIVIQNPSNLSMTNVKVKGEFPGKTVERLFEEVKKEESVLVRLNDLKKGQYKVRLSLDYTLEGANKRIEKELSVFVKEREAGKAVERGSVEEIFGV